MTALEDEFLAAIELHATDRLTALLDAGFDVAAPIRGKPATRWLTEMYPRSGRFPELLRALLRHGAPLDDPDLREVLLDDGPALDERLRREPELLGRRVSLACAFTPLSGVTLLHVAAEFQCGRAARVLLENGADPNAAASCDEDGLGGQTPIYHTVNSNGDRARPLRELLLASGARVDGTIAGLVWGRAFDWETTLFDLTPIAYAQCGNLPQMHRDELQVQETVESLLRAANRRVPSRRNVPNRYLRK